MSSNATSLEHSFYFWQQKLHTARSGKFGGIDGAALAALRRGINREAGSVPEMWPYYRELNDAGVLTPTLKAEHVVLTLFAVHQQSRREPVHMAGIPLGATLARLRSSGKFSEEAIDRRFAAFATATSLRGAATHLRGLITQLRSTNLRGIDQALDYTQLLGDLVDWQNPTKAASVRRRWGMQYFIRRRPDENSES